jgi:hypothetical protein
MNKNLDPAFITKFIHGSDFYDHHELEFNYGTLSALDIYIGLASNTPKWVNLLMLVRNKFVSLFGLKNLGALDDLKGIKANEVREGDLLGIFTLIHISDHEVVLNDTDKHLRVDLSIRTIQRLGKKSVVVTTVVKNHNMMGAMYMFFVKPIHTLIVPAMLTKFQRNN